MAEALKEGKERLKSMGKEQYALETERLLSQITGLSRVELFIKESMELTPKQAIAYEQALEMREKNRPLQYILGEASFMGLPFSVGEGVLIPRADTESLVEAVLEMAKKEDLITALDLGTGSGCIAIALAVLGKMRVSAVDISPVALGFAKENGERNGAEVRWLQGDLFSSLQNQEKGTFDVIVSNPPYIASKTVAGLMPEVRDFEPHNALDGGTDGLDFYRRIVLESAAWLKDGGWLFFEIGYDQGEALLSMMEEAGFELRHLIQDLTGLDRVVYGKWKKR